MINVEVKFQVRQRFPKLRPEVRVRSLLQEGELSGLSLYSKAVSPEVDWKSPGKGSRGKDL